MSAATGTLLASLLSPESLTDLAVLAFVLLVLWGFDAKGAA